MIKAVVEDQKNNQEEYVKLLADQGYTYKSMYEYILNIITDYDKYPAINLAYEETYSEYRRTREEVQDFVKSFIEDFVIPKIESEGSDYPYDYSELFDDIIEENSDEIDSFASDYDDLLDAQHSDWQSEIDDLNREYDRNRI